MGAMVVILDLSILGVVQSYEYLFYLNPGTQKHMVRDQNYLLMYYGYKEVIGLFDIDQCHGSHLGFINNRSGPILRELVLSESWYPKTYG